MPYQPSKACCPNNSKAIKALIEAGIIPQECRRFELIAEPNQFVTMRYEVHVTEEQMQQIADALIASPDEAKRVVAAIAFPRKDRVTVEV